MKVIIDGAMKYCLACELNTDSSTGLPNTEFVQLLKYLMDVLFTSTGSTVPVEQVVPKDKTSPNTGINNYFCTMAISTCYTCIFTFIHTYIHTYKHIQMPLKSNTFEDHQCHITMNINNEFS